MPGPLPTKANQPASQVISMRSISRSLRMGWTRILYLHRLAVATTFLVFSVVIILLLYNFEEVHSTHRQDHKNANAAVVLREGLHKANRGGDSKKLLNHKKLVSQKLRLVNEFNKANISAHKNLANSNNSVIGDGGARKYRNRADTRKALARKTKNGNGDLACQIPEMDPFDETIKHLIFEPEPLECKGTMATDLTRNQLSIKESVLKKMKYNQCYASTIERMSDYSSQISTPVKISFGTKNPKGYIPLQYNVTDDFTFVFCDNGTTDDFEDMSPFELESLYKLAPDIFDVHVGVVPKPKVKERARSIKPPSDGLGLNVVMLGLESTSRMNFFRQLPETYQLLSSFNTIVFEGYNIVADATKGALIPLLTGKTELELPEVRQGEVNSEYVDTYPLIWNDFAKNGYATMFAEDWPGIATFNLRLNGFDKQPTDHYMRNLWNAANTEKHCLGSKPVHKVMLDYLLDYMTVYKDTPHFAFSFLVGLTHANINPLKLMDGDLYWFLADAKFYNLLNNTILLMFGDHGSRYSQIRQTLQGKLEERLPFMSMTVPHWFHRRHPELYRKLKLNSQRLMTPFDVHETLKSVLHLDVTPADVSQRGISFFNEIPEKRTCTDAHIDAHWCSCLTWEPASSEKTKQAAGALIKIINKKTERVRDKCAKLKLSMVLHAQQMVPNQKVLRFTKTDDHNQRLASFSNGSTVNVTELPILFQVTVETLPGNGLFEGTIKVLPQSTAGIFVYETSGDISRINKYVGDLFMEKHVATCITTATTSSTTIFM
ncbi:uncharacterized protein [Asterias amurensis]|uniref:uncharacterized protein isoform X2 n=1 Tax=Asterias amurensis TaxID=7602 RepID=UPI003AB67875